MKQKISILILVVVLGFFGYKNFDSALGYGRTITNPATNSALSSAVMRGELQDLENEITSMFLLYSTNFAQNMVSTTTPFWFRGGLTASSTVYFDSATTSSLFVSGLTNTGSLISNASSTINGNLNIVGNSTTTIATTTTLIATTNASTTALTVSNSASALLLTNSSGLVGGYAGSGACTNQAVTAISALGATTCSSINNAYWSGADLSAANGGTGLSTFGGTNTIIFTTTADNLSSDTDLTYVGSTNILTAVNGAFTNATSTGSFTLPNGGTPLVLGAGRIALDTSDNQLLIGTTTDNTFPVIVPTLQKMWSYTIASTSVAFVNGGLIPLTPAREAFTIEEIDCYVKSGTSIVISIADGDGTNNTASTTCATTYTANSNQDRNISISASGLKSLEIGTITGSVDYLMFRVYGYYIRQ